MTSGLFPCTAQNAWSSVVHVLRQSTENFAFFYVNWWNTDPEVDFRPALCSRIQRNAWFDRGYKFCVSLRKISDFSTCLGGLGS